MELTGIRTSNDLHDVENKELLNLHYRCHQLYSLSLKNNNREFENRIIFYHKLISDEMIRRKIKHNSPLSPTFKHEDINKMTKKNILEDYLFYLGEGDKMKFKEECHCSTPCENCHCKDKDSEDELDEQISGNCAAAVGGFETFGSNKKERGIVRDYKPKV